ncbi:PAP2 superfamily protein [Paraphaeosphaeria sporulosa]
MAAPQLPQLQELSTFPTAYPETLPSFRADEPPQAACFARPRRRLPEFLSYRSDPTAPSKHSRLRAHLPKFRAPNPPDRPTLKQWLQRCWLDVLTQLLCILVAFIIYLTAPPLMTRYFPLYPGIHSTPWGLKHGQPYINEYINTAWSAAISFFVPFLLMAAVSGWWFNSFWDGNAACIGLGYALATSTLFQSLIKVSIGGLRPHFLSLCNPPIPPAYGATGHAPGVMYYTTDVCRGDPDKLHEAQMSFPSGHACAAFAGFGFLALYFNAKFGVLGHKPREDEKEDVKSGAGIVQVGVEEVQQDQRSFTRVPHWRLVLFAAPVLVAVIMAASKIRDMWHHPVDVVFGACVGVLFALMAYRMVYRAVWDQNKNHLARDILARDMGGGERANGGVQVGEPGIDDKGYVV